MAVVFPSDDQYTPLTRDGIVFLNPPFNDNPGATDMVGDANYPAIYFAKDATHSFFRFRLRSSPLLGGGFANYAWVVLIDTDMDLVDSYEWELALRGNSNDVALIQNLVPNSPNTGFKDTAEGVPISFPITAYDIARAVPADSMLGSVQNYFLDISIETAVLKGNLGIDESSPIRFNYFTGTNENNFNKDKMCEIADFDDCFSDFVTLSTIFTGTVLNKEDGSPICAAEVKIFKNGIEIADTTTDYAGNYLFAGLKEDDYRIKITKCCFLPLCSCNEVTVKKNQNNIYNFALAPDCICEIKCLILLAECELAQEKQRVYTDVTDYFNTIAFTEDTIWQYTRWLCMLDSGTAALDCCIAKVLGQLTICEAVICDG